jgi:hypothetical protein
MNRGYPRCQAVPSGAIHHLCTHSSVHRGKLDRAALHKVRGHRWDGVQLNSHRPGFPGSGQNTRVKAQAAWSTWLACNLKREENLGIHS